MNDWTHRNPLRAFTNVEVIVLVKGIRAMDSREACRVATGRLYEGEIIDTDAYIEEPETDPDER